MLFAVAVVVAAVAARNDGAAPASTCVAASLFGAPELYSAGVAFDYAVGDVDGDGLRDLVVPDYFGRLIVVHLAQPGLGFVPAAVIPVDGRPARLRVIDHDRDGLGDVVFQAGVGGPLVLLTNLGALQFSPEDLPVPWWALPTLAVADLDGDGDGDLVGAGSDASLSIWLRDEDDVFVAGDEIEVFGGVQSVFVRDLDGDGDDDVVTYPQGTASITVLRSDGLGGLVHDPSIVTPPVTRASGFVGDPDDDGDLDFLVADRHDGLGWITAERGRYVRREFLPFDSRLGYAEATDFDGDGHLDIVVIVENLDSFVSADLWVATGEPSLRFDDATCVASVDSERSIAACDHDGDGDPDLVLWRYGPAARILENDGTGRFDADERLWGFAPTGLSYRGYVFDVATSDLDGDGIADLGAAVTTPAPGSSGITIRRGRPDGWFDPPVKVPTSSTPYFLAMADLDLDGRDDLVSASLFGQVELRRGIGPGVGDFAEPVGVTLPEQLSDLVVADLDADGFPDVAISSREGDVHVLLGDGEGGARSVRSSALGEDFAEIVVIDHDGDGRPDLAVTDPGAARVLLVSIDGDGTPAIADVIELSGFPASIDVADADGDGRDDLWVTHGKDVELLTIVSMTSERPSAGPPVDLQSFSRPILVGDHTGDGRPDAIVGRPNFNAIAVVQLNAAGELDALHEFPVGDSPHRFADLPAIGQHPAGLVVANYSDGTISIKRTRCLPCPQDLDGDGSIGYGDLVVVLETWGPCEQCGGDVTGDGVVDGDDLIAILGAWGDCS